MVLQFLANNATDARVVGALLLSVPERRRIRRRLRNMCCKPTRSGCRCAPSAACLGFLAIRWERGLKKVPAAPSLEHDARPGATRRRVGAGRVVGVRADAAVSPVDLDRAVSAHPPSGRLRLGGPGRRHRTAALGAYPAGVPAPTHGHRLLGELRECSSGFPASGYGKIERGHRAHRALQQHPSPTACAPHPQNPRLL